MHTLKEDDPLDIFARTIWGEARGQGRAGMTTVACVILNRVAEPGRWGHNVYSVCSYPGAFSCWHDSNQYKVENVTEHDPQFRQALDIADAGLRGELKDVTHGADAYLSAGFRRPIWARRSTLLAHNFHGFDLYKLPAQIGRIRSLAIKQDSETERLNELSLANAKGQLLPPSPKEKP